MKIYLFYCRIEIYCREDPSILLTLIIAQLSCRANHARVFESGVYGEGSADHIIILNIE